MKRTIWVGIIGGVLLLLALLLNWLNNSAPDPEATEPPAQSAPQETVEAPADSTTPAPVIKESGTESDSPEPSQAPSTETAQPTQAPVAEADQPTDPAANQDAQPAEPTEPSFDVVRIEPNGDAVIAGRAEPRSQVTILDGGDELGAVAVDERGEWVYLPSRALEPGPHELKLKSELSDGRIVFGGGTVVLVVPKPGQDIAGRDAEGTTPQQPVVVLIPDESKPGAEIIQRPSTNAMPSESASGNTLGADTSGDSAPGASATSEAASLAASGTSNGAAPSSSAITSTSTAEPTGVQSADGSLSVDTVDYDPQGNISIAGTGPSDTTVLAYLDNVLIGNSRVRDDKSWRIDPHREVAPGVYNLRLDAMRSSSVIARLEIPFSRAAPLTDLQGDAFIVVQPGNSLWRIARRTLGEGFSYTIIYDANSDQIRDPDLIYPGQVFEIPGN